MAERISRALRFNLAARGGVGVPYSTLCSEDDGATSPGHRLPPNPIPISSHDECDSGQGGTHQVVEQRAQVAWRRARCFPFPVPSSKHALHQRKELCVRGEMREGPVETWSVCFLAGAEKRLGKTRLQEK